jgi:hypothetical protein
MAAWVTLEHVLALTQRQKNSKNNPYGNALNTNRFSEAQRKRVG